MRESLSAPHRWAAAATACAWGSGCRPPRPGGPDSSASRSTWWAPGRCPAAYRSRPGGPAAAARFHWTSTSTTAPGDVVSSSRRSWALTRARIRPVKHQMGDWGAMTATSTRQDAPTAVLPPLQIGRHTIESPVVLAPMAGITNRAFRKLCREYGDRGLDHGGASGATSLYVSEMITSRALVERTPESMRLIEHDPQENPRSIQLYGVDPATVAAAVRMLV